MELKSFIEKYNNTNIVIKIFVGIILGISAAYIFPNATWLSVLGSLFVGALKAIAPILVFILVISSLANGVRKQESKFCCITTF